MKQVIVVNEALKLPRGKLAAQVAHAALDAFLNASPKAQQRWLELGMPKVVLQVESEAEIHSLERQANDAGLPVAVIADAGHTVVEAGTITCVGIGPAEIAVIDKLTGALKLVR
jgi:PTH2 family peptidyl-tRNA hydrolase